LSIDIDFEILASDDDVAPTHTTKCCYLLQSHIHSTL